MHDILIYSRTLVEHAHLSMVFTISMENDLYANKKKCEFARERIEYLRHVISAKGVEVDERKDQGHG